MEKEFGKEWIYVYVEQIHCKVQYIVNQLYSNKNLFLKKFHKRV